MTEPRIQRSYYLTEDQARRLKLRAVELDMTASDLLGWLIDHLDAAQIQRAEVQTKTQEQARTVAATKRARQHELLAKMAKQ